MAHEFRTVAAATERESCKALTWPIQLTALLLLLVHAIGLADLDAPVAALWRLIYGRSFFHTPMAEATVAAVSFLLWIGIFRSLDKLAWVQQFRLVPRPLEKGAHVLIQDFLAALAALAKKSPLQYRRRRALRIFASFPVYLLAILLLHLFKTPQPLQEEPPRCWRLVGETVFGIWAYDFFFFWLHLAMHRWPSAWHGHYVHHGWRDGTGADVKAAARFLEAEVVVNHSLTDAALQVITNIVVQNLMPFGISKHKLSRFLHNIVVTYLLTECHSGLDLPWGSHRLFPKIMGGAPRHELHHNTHQHCYHQFFTYLDDFFGYGPPPSYNM